MVLLPTDRLLALMVAVAVVPLNVTDPRLLPPDVNVTVPVGRVVPAAAFTVIVSIVVAVGAIDAAFAVTVVVVETGVTVTAPIPEEAAKLPVGA